MTDARSGGASTSMHMGIAALRSGKTADAVAHFRHAVAADPKHADAHLNLGVALRLAGSPEDSYEALRSAERLDPQSAQIAYNLALADAELGKTQGALQRMAEAARLAPKSANILSGLAVLQTQTGNFKEGVDNFRKAVKLEPHNAVRHHNLGGALLAAGASGEAIPFLRKAVSLNPRRDDSRFHLANALMAERRGEEAMALYHRLVDKSPHNVELQEKYGDALMYERHYIAAAGAYRIATSHEARRVSLKVKLAEALLGAGLGDEALAVLEQAQDNGHGVVAKRIADTLERMGQFAEAAAAQERILQAKPGNVWALASLVQNPKADFRPEYETILEQASENSGLPDTEQAAAAFALGHLWDARGEYKRAFASFERGNAFSKRNNPFAPEAHRAQTTEIIARFTPEFIASGAEQASSSQLPVFVVGMPRTGTTLVEQILSGHPEMQAGGESHDMQFFAEKLTERAEKPFPACVEGADEDHVRCLQKELVSRRQSLWPGAKRIIDKTPAHGFFLGLAAHMFPNAALLHCRRDPLDACLSMYFQQFSGNHPYAGDLQWLGAYAYDFARIMHHWNSFLNVLDIQYEELVVSVEATARNMVEHTGLAWDHAVLNYRDQITTVTTLSNWQVRRPITPAAIGRWKNYERFLDPLKRALEDEVL